MPARPSDHRAHWPKRKRRLRARRILAWLTRHREALAVVVLSLTTAVLRLGLAGAAGIHLASLAT